MKGSIRQRGNDDKKWEIRYDLPPGPDGKRKQKQEIFIGTKPAAQKRLNAILAQIQSGAFTEPTKITLAAYLEKWLTDCAKSSVAATTYERYVGIVRKNIIPAIGNVRLDRLTPLQLQTFESDLLKTGRVDGSGGLSPKTVIQVHRVLHRALGQAVRWELLVRNPADGVSLPRIERRRQTTVLSREQTLKLLEHASRTQYFFAPVLLCIASGMRRGEILALTWDDVNLDTCMLSVNKSLEETTEYGLRVKETKSTNGERTVRLPKWAVAELRWWKAQQAQHKLLLGDLYQDHNLICSRQDGSYIRPDTFSSTFRSLVKTVGVENSRFHDLRHSQATVLIAGGIPVKVVSERLGHSTTTITQDIYTHVLPDMQQQAADLLDHIYGPIRKQESA